MKKYQSDNEKNGFKQGCFVFKPKMQIWVNFGGYILRTLGPFYGLL
jgi:hypothetical protein